MADKPTNLPNFPTTPVRIQIDEAIPGGLCRSPCAPYAGWFCLGVICPLSAAYCMGRKMNEEKPFLKYGCLEKVIKRTVSILNFPDVC